jgi:hypothetical protein
MVGALPGYPTRSRLGRRHRLEIEDLGRHLPFPGAQAPEVPLAAPGVDSAAPAPVEPPAISNLPPADAGVPSDAVMAIGGG